MHWDGKLLPDLTGKEKVDRLPVLVSGEGTMKLLSVPLLPSGTGTAIANAVFASLDDWGLTNRVQGMSFDTTASNTGHTLGACTFLQQKLGRGLLHFACHHHILEILVSKVFAECFTSASTGPDILLFQRFKKNWRWVITDQFQPFNNNELAAEPLLADRLEVIACCEAQLHNSQPRDDYRELLELTIISLGGIPQRGIHFYYPGALHRARWMARVIYALKIYLFREQFQLTASEKTGLRRFVLFTVSTYVCAWFAAPLASAAPSGDLSLLKRLAAYEDKGISKVGTSSLCRHLWYLSEELTALAFFDDGTAIATKRKMVAALTDDGAEDPPKRITVDPGASSLQSKTVANFITNASMSLFRHLNISTAFLQIDPSEWENCLEYKCAVTRIRGPKVVNDFAERGVALMQEFNHVITKDENQKQFLLQIVERHRRHYPDSKKSTVASGSKD